MTEPRHIARVRPTEWQHGDYVRWRFGGRASTHIVKERRNPSYLGIWTVCGRFFDDRSLTGGAEDDARQCDRCWEGM